MRRKIDWTYRGSPLIAFMLIFLASSCREPAQLEGFGAGPDTYDDIDTAGFDWGDDDSQSDSSVETPETAPETDTRADTESISSTSTPPDSDTTSSMGGCPAGSELVMVGPRNPFRWGNEKELVFVEAATDFRCPYCASFAVMAEDIWAKRPEFQKFVRFYFQHYPLESLHPDSWDVHAMSVAVHNQDPEAFWLLHDTIYETSADNSPMSLEEIETFVSEELDLDMDRFEADRESSETLSFIAGCKARGKDAGVQGTPTVFVCGQKISWSTLEEQVDKYLSSK